MNPKLRALLALKQEKLTAARALSDAAGDAGMVAEVAAQFDALMGEANTVQASIEREKSLIEAERATPALPAAVIPALSGAIVVDNIENDPRRGFAHMGDFAKSVKGAFLRPADADGRLVTLNAAATTYGNEAVGADGGYRVPPEFSQSIMRLALSEDSLLSRTQQIPLSGNSLTLPVDETTDHGTTGILAYWDAEAATISQTKPSFKDVTLKLSRLTALVPVTNELLEDSSSLGAYISSRAPAKMNFKINDAILNGTGVGQPLGLLNAGCTVSVAKETSQAAATLLGANVLKMYSRMPVANRRNAVWIVNQDIEAQLWSLNIPVKNAASSENVAAAGPVYLAPNGLQSAPDGMLLGRPIVFTEAAQTIGTTGDIFLADMSQYLAIVKAGGVKSDFSMHLYFDQNMSAFRFVFRMGGQPWLSTAITRKNGSNTLSHFVKLDTR